MTNADPTENQKSYRVSFKEVGRNKKSWTATLNQQPTEAVLEHLVRKSGTLGSRDIECVFDDDLEYGIVIVGGVRSVGAFRVEAV